MVIDSECTHPNIAQWKEFSYYENNGLHERAVRAGLLAVLLLTAYSIP